MARQLNAALIEHPAKHLQERQPPVDGQTTMRSSRMLKQWVIHSPSTQFANQGQLGGCPARCPLCSTLLKNLGKRETRPSEIGQIVTGRILEQRRFDDFAIHLNPGMFKDKPTMRNAMPFDI
jgi:hypothetical protein